MGLSNPAANGRENVNKGSRIAAKSIYFLFSH